MTDEKIIAEWNKERYLSEREVLFITTLRQKLNSEQIAHVLRTLETTCDKCWDNDRKCHCWNDE